MPHRCSPAAAARRHERARLRGYITARPAGFVHVLARADVADATRAASTALQMHIDVDRINAVPHHTLRGAALAAREVLEPPKFVQVMKANRKAGSMKHRISHRKSEMCNAPTMDPNAKEFVPAVTADYVEARINQKVRDVVESVVPDVVGNVIGKVVPGMVGGVLDKLAGELVTNLGRIVLSTAQDTLAQSSALITLALDRFDEKKLQPLRAYGPTVDRRLGELEEGIHQLEAVVHGLRGPTLGGAFVGGSAESDFAGIDMAVLELRRSLDNTAKMATAFANSSVGLYDKMNSALGYHDDFAAKGLVEQDTSEPPLPVGVGVRPRDMGCREFFLVAWWVRLCRPHVQQARPAPSMLCDRPRVDVLDYSRFAHIGAENDLDGSDDGPDDGSDPFFDGFVNGYEALQQWEDEDGGTSTSDAPGRSAGRA
eukprot:CAMPEP_0198489180 /NCGR_PEP_ID=MMETSP1462-20131121/1278_1 /TAXON_ID=1333877 /ORGANISM="Brandtodinium nutriculum, Strain RCC3387" /LENGTH=427 /DNA_ID=CAMNT_0044217673 /DNA_START=126 /DNA_END=1407 /DNA_ORIENTATION=+